MDLTEVGSSTGAILNLIVLSGWACVLLLVDLFISRQRKGLTAILAALGLLVTLGVTFTQIGREASAFGGMLEVDGYAIFLNVLFLISGLVGIALAYDYLTRMGIQRGEYYTLLLFSITGMMLMAMAADLIVVFLALELLSIPLYVLAGFARTKLESEEASLKYFLLGAFSTGIIVYGTALIFGATGTTSLAGIVAAAGGSADPVLLSIGAALVFIGLGFKVAAVPFHMWTPDVYQGAPTAVTAFMAVGAKAGGFAALFRIFVVAFPALSDDLTPVLWGVAALTMILGNFVAIAQTNMKRLLAYSSIAHAGYILMALVPYAQGGVAVDGVASALFYLLAYAFTNFAAWSVVIALERAEATPAAYPLDEASPRARALPRGVTLTPAGEAVASRMGVAIGRATGAVPVVAAAPVTAQAAAPAAAVRTYDTPAPAPDGFATVEATGRGLTLDEYAGLGRKYPFLAAVMAVAMLSFTGVPPTLGFAGKFFVFRTVLEGGFLGLALIGVLTSLVSAYYYLRVVVVMYMRDGEPLARKEPWLYIAAGVSALATLLLVLFSTPLFRWVAQATLRLF